MANNMDKASISLALSQDLVEGIKESEFRIFKNPKAGSVISKVLNSKVLKTVGGLMRGISKFSPWLGGIGAIISIIGAARYNSIEVQKLDHLLEVVNKEFLRMEVRIDNIEAGIEDVKNTMKEEHIWTKLSPEIKKLHSVKERVLNFYRAKDRTEKEIAREALRDRQQFEKVQF